MRDKIQASHLERRAAVYLRQSTLHQVADHCESTARQYRLRERALELGWTPERIDVIDTDLGLSGSSTRGRIGFQKLAEGVAHGRVGAIFAVEVSRFARSSADWHRLLDLCRLADVVIVDEQSIYAPRDNDDRLLLGLKGTMSEAEQSWMQLRLQGAALNKARRGELYKQPPTGYDWDAAAGRIILYPDEEVQRAVRLVFERFRVDGTAWAVIRYFGSQGLLFPSRDPYTRALRWQPPRHGLIINMLHNPVYAGAYVHGVLLEHVGLVNGEIRRQSVRWPPQESWKVCLKDHHPAYIGWDEYLANVKKLEANRSNHLIPKQRGAAREGAALLQGVLLCGRCGHRMKVSYDGRNKASYYCRGLNRRLGLVGGQCASMLAGDVDTAVVGRFLAAFKPDELDLSLAVAKEAERQADDVARQWDLRLERARYEARHAERRYKAIDPDNRNVARTLEKEWNDALAQLEELETQRQEAQASKHLQLTQDDRQKIRRLSRDLPSVWAAPTTTPTDRKNLLRMAIEEITLSRLDLPAAGVRVQILWKSGKVEELTLLPQELISSPGPDPSGVQAFMAQGLTDAEIVDALNQAGSPSITGRPWTLSAVRGYRYRHGLRRRSSKAEIQSFLDSRQGRPSRRKE